MTLFYMTSCLSCFQSSSVTVNIQPLLVNLSDVYVSRRTYQYTVIFHKKEDTMRLSRKTMEANVKC